MRKNCDSYVKTKNGTRICVHCISISAIKETNHLINKVVIHFYRMPLVTFETVFFSFISENVLPAMIQVFVVLLNCQDHCRFNMSQYLKPSLTHSRF